MYADPVDDGAVDQHHAKQQNGKDPDDQLFHPRSFPKKDTVGDDHRDDTNCIGNGKFGIVPEKHKCEDGRDRRQDHKDLTPFSDPGSDRDHDQQGKRDENIKGTCGVAEGSVKYTVRIHLKQKGCEEVDHAHQKRRDQQDPLQEIQDPQHLFSRLQDGNMSPEQIDEKIHGCIETHGHHRVEHA